MYCSILLHHFYQVFNPVLLVYWSRQWTSNPKVVGSNPPWGKHEFSFFIFCVFWTKIGIFYALMHKERHKRSLFYFLKIYNNCSFSFSSKMKFSISQLDVVEMNNWEHVLNGCEKTITELPSNVSEHFFKTLNL